MVIKSHKLFRDDGSPLPFQASPNVGSNVNARYLVMHYTGGSSAQSSANWLCNPAAKASAHVVIGRDGSVVQLVPFNKVAWHAGRSAWEGLKGMNAFSIGIELDNAGKVVRRGDGKWQNGLGVLVPDADVVEGAHKNDSVKAHWQSYPAVQLDAAAEVAGALVEKYGLLDVIGHDDIAPGRKIDPGPAFAMESFRSRVMGRQDTELELFQTTTNLNIRSGPGVQFDKVSDAPLPKGTRLAKERAQGEWFFVDVQDGSDLEGWVSSRYVERIG